MFSQFGLKTKLLVLCFGLSLVSLVIGVAGFLSLHYVSKNYAHVAKVNLPSIKLAGEMFANYRKVRIGLRTLGLPGITPVQAEDAIKTAQEGIADFEKSLSEFSAIEYSPGVNFGAGEKELFDKTTASWTTFKAVGERVFKLYRSGSTEDRAQILYIFFHDCPDAAKDFTIHINELIAYQDKEASTWVDHAESTSSQANSIIIITAVICLVIGCGLGLILATSTTRAINEVSTGLANGAHEVESVANEIAQAALQLSSGANQQAAAIQETTAAVDQTSAMVKRTADNADRSSHVTESSHQAALEGKQAVQQMMHSISDISNSNDQIMDQISQSNQEIAQITKLIAEIGDKTKIINEIVFQTKLLSFNASVEAARAGEHGKGFAVVAEEIGNLASISGKSAKEISEMLDERIKKVEEIIEGTKANVERLIQVGKDKVSAGRATATRCGDTLDRIVTHVSEVNTMVAEISTASREQDQGVQEITKAMNQMSQVAEINNSASHSASSSAVSLQQQVGDLRQMIEHLNQTIRGRKEERAA